MIRLIDIKPWYEVGANIAAIISTVAIVFVIIEYSANKNVRNIQLMQRCIDMFRLWYEKESPKVDLQYLEILNEELFYFQQKLITKKIAIEWIEGIMDNIVIYDNKGNPLNSYAGQTEIKKLAYWKDKRYFYHRIHYFTHTRLSNNYKVPAFDDKEHSYRKRELALALYKHIKNYSY